MPPTASAPPAHQGGMKASEQPRIPAGAPRSAGGQWAAATRREAAVDLSEDREAAIASGEHVPAIFTTGDRAGERADRWWDTQASLAEWAGEGAAFPKMPGDWTPRRTVGSADSGLRRTHRITYSGNGFSLRMPSATSIRSFSAAGRGAFDIPVDATDERGRAITAWVRAVQHKPGHWSVSGLGFGGVTDAKVSEAVASVLESRRPDPGAAPGRRPDREAPAAARRPGRGTAAGPLRLDRRRRLLRRRPHPAHADQGRHQRPR